MSTGVSSYEKNEAMAAIKVMAADSSNGGGCGISRL